ncbi:MAG TPA: hypothetical protein VFI15_06910 [Candidatus Limnocylindrales bacterium]|nr:hypothetical protein [Candidatus Limnocylindrales bacterium]
MSQNVQNPLEPATASEPAIPVAPGPVTSGTVTSGPVTSRRGVSNRALNVLLGGALVLAIAGVAFAAGRMTAPAAQGLTGGTFPNGGVFNGQGRGNGQGGFGTNGQGGAIFGNGGGPTIEGTVESVSDTTLTLKTADGQTIQVALSGDTTYHAQSDATASDVVTGATVQVRLNVRRGTGGPQATAGTGGGATAGDLTANDVTVVP